MQGKRPTRKPKGGKRGTCNGNSNRSRQEDTICRLEVGDRCERSRCGLYDRTLFKLHTDGFLLTCPTASRKGCHYAAANPASRQLSWPQPRDLTGRKVHHLRGWKPRHGGGNFTCAPSMGSSRRRFPALSICGTHRFFHQIANSLPLLPMAR